MEKYEYNAIGAMVHKESWISGAEKTHGISVEDNIYNDKGHLIASCMYNTLSPSDKFYTEYVLDENGREIGAVDATGEYRTSYSFVTPEGTTVKCETLPNGSKLAYSFDNNGTLTSITHSTSEGEENSVDREYTCGVLTGLKSGNHKVAYTYDEKGL